MLERGVQRTAADILHSKENAGEEEESNNPPGFSDESEVEETSVRKSGRSKKGPSRYGNPIKHSVKSISYHNDLLDLNQAALEAYRIKLANFKPMRRIRWKQNLAYWRNISLEENSAARRSILTGLGMLSGGFHYNLRKSTKRKTESDIKSFAQERNKVNKKTKLLKLSTKTPIH